METLGPLQAAEWNSPWVVLMNGLYEEDMRYDKKIMTTHKHFAFALGAAGNAPLLCPLCAAR